MYIINVIPISKSAFKDTLSYFAKRKIAVGSVIKISLRNKKILGIVAFSESLKDMKSSVKNADFKMKKIENESSFELFTPEFIKAVEKISDYYVSSRGTMFDALVPSVILQNPEKITAKINKSSISSITNKSEDLEMFATQDKDVERISRYKNIIREEFAKKHSVFICAPTINDIDWLYNSIKKGLENYVHKLHNNLTKKEIISGWNNACNEKHPVVIIATGKFLSIPRNDIKTIIVEKENSSFYKMNLRPFLDIRKFVEFLINETGCRVVLGDDILRIETMWRHKEGQIYEVGHIKSRYEERAKIFIENLSDNKKNMWGGEKNEMAFRVFGEKLDETIKDLKQNKEKLFLFTIRKGLYPVVFCRDCGELVRCENCKHPVILYEQNNKRFLSCNMCNEKRDVDKKCRFCNSWKLDTLGVGIDLVEKKIKENYKDIPLFKIESESVKTHKKALQIIDSFNKSDFGILLSTEMGLNYIKIPVQNSAIVSMDSLFSIPNFYMSEKIFSIITQIKLFTENNLIIQTRNSDENLIKLASEGNIGEFYRYEIENRKKFSYPPFIKFIKISISEKKENIKKIVDIIKKELVSYNISVYPSSRSKIRNNETINILISIQNEKWVDNNLLEKLYLLPQRISVEVDPENIL